MEPIMSNYTAVIDGEMGRYGAWFPDLPGCTAMGDTLDQLIFNATDAMRDWAAILIERGERPPAPRPIEILRGDPHVLEALQEGAHLRSVPLIMTSGKPIKANLSLDTGVLAAIDAEAKRRGLTRSALVEWLAREALPRLAG
jgi:predicted RNase H-like HicB family nuclease